MMKNYYKPTPKKWRQIGDSIMVGCAGLSAIVTGGPFSDNHKMWIMFALNVTGVLGKVVTNLFKEEENETPVKPTVDN